MEFHRALLYNPRMSLRFGNPFKFLFCLFLIGNSIPANAITFEEAQGSWTRVGDGCRELNPSELARLSTNGGGNSSRRRMQMTITEEGFSATSYPSLRCESGFERNDAIPFDNHNVWFNCANPATNSGRITFDGDHVYTSAKDCRRVADNPWGCTLTDWKVRRVGDVLEFKYQHPQECKSGEHYFYIYFIPAPLS